MLLWLTGRSLRRRCLERLKKVQIAIVVELQRPCVAVEASPRLAVAAAGRADEACGCVGCRSSAEFPAGSFVRHLESSFAVCVLDTLLHLLSPAGTVTPGS